MKNAFLEKSKKSLTVLLAVLCVTAVLGGVSLGVALRFAKDPSLPIPSDQTLRADLDDLYLSVTEEELKDADTFRADRTELDDATEDWDGFALDFLEKSPVPDEEVVEFQSPIHKIKNLRILIKQTRMMMEDVEAETVDGRTAVAVYRRQSSLVNETAVFNPTNIKLGMESADAVFFLPLFLAADGIAILAVSVLLAVVSRKSKAQKGDDKITT